MDSTPNTLRIFHDAVAFVTGGASGIGRALATELVRRGARPVLADRQIDLAREVNDTIGGAGAIELDVRDGDAFARAVGDVVREHGRLDYLFNNAGIVIAGGAELCSLDDWDQVVDVNLRGVCYGVHAAYPRMIEQGFGHIVSTASVAGFLPTPGIASYGATKHAVVGLTKALRAEGAVHGVRFSAICPGVVRTPIIDGGRYGKHLVEIPSAVLDRLLTSLRPIEPEALATAALDGVARNRAFIVVPRWWRLIRWLERLAPGFVLAGSARQYARMERERE